MHYCTVINILQRCGGLDSSSNYLLVAYVFCLFISLHVIDVDVICFTVVAQDNRRLCLTCCRCKSLEHVTTGDHVIAITADFQACIEDRTASQIVRQCTLAATAALTLA